MARDEQPPDLLDIPETDFSQGMRPNRYANLRGQFEHAVFLDEDLWRHFGSEETVLQVLRSVVEIARRSGPTKVA